MAVESTERSGHGRAGTPRLLRTASDGRLARLAADGDEAAASEIFSRHRAGLSRYCLSLTGRPEDAADALQNTMVRAFGALRAQAPPRNLRPWLYRIAHNEAIRIARGRPQDAELTDTLPALAAGEDVAGTVADRDRLRTLVGDLQALPERQRAALVMRELSGLEFAAIGEALQITPAAAKQAAYEARLALTDLAGGRETSCEVVRRRLSDGDGRVLRGRATRAHLRGCEDCRAFAAAFDRRRRDLAVLFPPFLLPAGLLGLGASSAHAAVGSAAGGGGAGASGAGASGAGASGAGASGAGAGGAGGGAGGTGAIGGFGGLGATGLAAGAGAIAVAGIVAVAVGLPGGDGASRSAAEDRGAVAAQTAGGRAGSAPGPRAGGAPAGTGGRATARTGRRSGASGPVRRPSWAGGASSAPGGGGTASGDAGTGPASGPGATPVETPPDGGAERRPSRPAPRPPARGPQRPAEPPAPAPADQAAATPPAAAAPDDLSCHAGIAAGTPAAALKIDVGCTVEELALPIVPALVVTVPAFPPLPLPVPGLGLPVCVAVAAPPPVGALLRRLGDIQVRVTCRTPGGPRRWSGRAR